MAGGATYKDFAASFAYQPTIAQNNWTGKTGDICLCPLLLPLLTGALDDAK